MEKLVETRARRDRVIRDGRELRKMIAGTVRRNHASLEVNRSVGDVQKPWASVEVLITATDTLIASSHCQQAPNGSRGATESPLEELVIVPGNPVRLERRIELLGAALLFERGGSYPTYTVKRKPLLRVV